MLSQLFLKNSFKIFNFEIHYYAICIVLGFSIAALLAVPLFKKRGLKPDFIIDLLIGIIPLAIFFARLWYVVLDIDEFDGFLDAINLLNGGLAIHGGILGGAIGLVIVCLIKKKNIGRVMDCAAVVLPFGQAVGRWGNFFNQEVYGKPTSVTWMPYSVYIEKTGMYHHALCFYEMFLNLILFGLLYFFLMRYSGKRNFYTVGIYLLGYGIIRAVLEPLRMEEFQMGYFGIPASVITSVLLIALGAGIIVYLLIADIKDKDYWWKRMFDFKTPLVVEFDGGVVTESSQNSLQSDNEANLYQANATEPDNKENTADNAMILNVDDGKIIDGGEQENKEN